MAHQATAPAPAARTAGSRLVGFDGLRALAALEVVATHVMGHAGYDRFSGRNLGVTILFVMSGFLLYRPHARAHLTGAPRPSTRTFAVRRALRILPAYWLVLLAVLVATPSLRPAGTGEWLRQLFLLQTYKVNGFLPGFESIWSLGTELAFYAVLPLLAWALLSRGRRSPRAQYRFEMTVLLLLVPLSYVFRWAVLGPGWLNPLTASYWMPSFIGWFSLGMALAVMREWNTLNPGRRSAVTALAGDELACVLLAAAAFGMSATSLGGPTDFSPLTLGERTFRITAVALAALLLMLPSAVGTTPPGPWRRTLAWGPLAALGTLAYGIYLWHLPVINLLEDHIPLPSGPAAVLVLGSATLAVTLPLAWLTYRYVEKPAVDLSHRLTPSTATARVAAEPASRPRPAVAPLPAPLVPQAATEGSAAP